MKDKNTSTTNYILYHPITGFKQIKRSADENYCRTKQQDRNAEYKCFKPPFAK